MVLCSIGLIVNMKKGLRSLLQFVPCKVKHKKLLDGEFLGGGEVSHHLTITAIDYIYFHVTLFQLGLHKAISNPFAIGTTLIN